MRTRYRISVMVDSRPPFDGERYWRWEVYTEEFLDEAIATCGARRIFAMGWRHTKAQAVQLARFVRAEISR